MYNTLAVNTAIPLITRSFDSQAAAWKFIQTEMSTKKNFASGYILRAGDLDNPDKTIDLLNNWDI